MAGFTSRQSYNGVSYKVYVPENCNANTEVLVYCHGGEDTDSWYGTDYLKQHGGDTVVIFPTADEGFRETNDYGYQVANIVNNVKQDLNITNTSLSVAGFSKGSTPTYTIMGEYLKQNPNCSSSTMFLLDNYPNAKFSSTKKFDILLNDYGNYYKDNNTMFVAMIPQWSSTGTNIIGAKQAELDALAKYGLTNISVLHSHKATYPGYYKGLNIGGDAHQVVEQGFWVDGFFNMSSNASVLYGEDEYKLTIFNKSTGQYELVDFGSLNSLDKLRQYFGINISTGVSTGVTNLNNGSNFLKDEISKLSGLSLYSTSDGLVKSDKDILLGNVNNVITDIKNTSFVSNGLDLSFSGSSTTKVPSGIPNIIGLYFTFTTNLLTELSTFMNKVATAGESIDKMDEELSNEASNLNNNAQLNTDTNTITDSATGNINTSFNDTSSGNNTTNTNSGNYNRNNSYGTGLNNNYNSGYNNSYSTGNNNYGTGSNNNYSTGTNNNYSTGSNNNYLSNNDKVTTIPQDTWEGATTVVGNDNKPSTPNVNVGSGITNTVGTNDVVSTPEVPSDTIVSTPEDNAVILPEVDVPKHDINNINIGNNSSLGDSTVVTPEIDNIINNNNDLINIPVTNPEPIKKDNTLSSLGVALGVGTALGVGGIVASKAFKKNKEEKEENLEESDISQYKDDYYEEV